MKTTVRNGRAMGSSLRLTLPGVVSEPAADATWAAASCTFAQVERELTRFDPDSGLSRLNRAGGAWHPISPLLSRALVAAWRAYRATGGRFDPRVIGALEAAGERAGVPLPPSPARLLAGERWLALDARGGRARVAAPLDLGGIGKGLALRWAAATLRRRQVRHFLLAAGGDVVASGSGPAGRPWVVALEDPVSAPARLAVIELQAAAVATSSIAVRAWRGPDGTPRHHLIDPASGRPAPSVWRSITVEAADPAWAEVMAKAAFLAGRRAPEVIGRHRSWMVDPDGRLRSE